MKKFIIILLFVFIGSACDQETVSPPGVYLTIDCFYGDSCSCDSLNMSIAQTNTYKYLQIRDMDTDAIYYDVSTGFQFDDNNGTCAEPKTKNIHFTLPKSGTYELGFYIGNKPDSLGLYSPIEINYTENTFCELGRIPMFRCQWDMECCTQTHCVPKYDYETGEKIDFDPFVGEGVNFAYPATLFKYDDTNLLVSDQHILKVDTSTGDRSIYVSNYSGAEFSKINNNTLAFLSYESGSTYCWKYNIKEVDIITNTEIMIVSNIEITKAMYPYMVYLNNNYYSYRNLEVSSPLPKDLKTDIIKIDRATGDIHIVSNIDIGTGPEIGTIADLRIIDNNNLLIVSGGQDIGVLGELIKVNIQTGDRTVIDSTMDSIHFADYYDNDEAIIYDSSTYGFAKMNLITGVILQLNTPFELISRVYDLYVLGDYVYYTIPEQRAIYQIDLINNETSILSYSDCGEP